MRDLYSETFKNRPKSISRRDFIKVSMGGIVLLSLPSWGSGEEESREWWFVHISDTHSGGKERHETLKKVLEDVKSTFPQAKFMLNTGDVTEHGWEEELDDHVKGMEGFPIPHFEIMGNHDSRWSRSGRYAFRQRFKGTRWAIEHPNLSVFALDCSILVEQHGHLDPSELSWLEEQLKRLRGKAAMVAFHHPPCDPKRFLDTDGDLFQLLAEYNVAAILGGHIHQRKEYQVNGTWVITSGATMSPKSGYCVFRVRPGEVTLFDRRPLEDQTQEVMTIPLDRTERDQLSLSEVRLRPRKRKGQVWIRLPEKFNPEKIALQINGHAQEVKWSQQGRYKNLVIPTQEMTPGYYEVELITPNGKAREQKRAWGSFAVSSGKNLGLRWQIDLPAGIQSQPAFCGERLIVASNEGRVRALSKKSGRKIWEYDSGPDAILSSPVIQSCRVYFGTMDEHVVCLSAESGKMIWKRKLEGSVIATGTFAGKKERLILGTGKGKLYALSPMTGKTEWVYQTGNLIKATPAYDGQRLFFGAWDGCFYALDAETGEEAWKLKMQTPHFSPATCNPKVIDGKVIIVTHDYRTHCLNSGTGERIWSFPDRDVQYNYASEVVSRCKPSYSSAIFYQGVAYLGSLTGHVVGFDLETGKQSFELEVDDPVFDSFPIRVKDSFYFGTTGGTLYSLNLKTQKVDWKYSLGPHFIFSSPASDGQYLTIGSLAGRLACFEIA